MRQQRSKDCFHKIICFQKHPNCQEVAAICQKKCQVSHRTNNPSTFVSVEAVHLQFSKIRSKLIEALKIYSDKFTKEYEQLMKAFQKKYTDSLMAMERQMLNMIIKHTNMNKDFLDKIENERLQKLRCNQIYTFLEEQNTIQQKIKSAALLPIYEKHLNSLRQIHKNFNGSNNNLQKQTNFKQISYKTSSIHTESPKSSIKQINQQNQNCKMQIKALKEDKLRLQNELLMHIQAKQRNLQRYTSDYLKVTTRKRLKKLREKNVQTVHHETTENKTEKMIPEPSQEQLNIDGNKDFDSEEIIDFIQQKRKVI